MGRSLSRSALPVAFTVLGALVVYWGIAWSLQRRVLFPGAGDQAGRQAPPPPGAERLSITTPQGLGEALYLPGRGRRPGSPGPAVIFAHGNAETVDDWVTPLSPYVRRGVSVLLPEYRGYGRSRGSPSQEHLTRDLVRLYDILAAHPDVDPQRIIVHGRSVGGGVACALAARRRPAALILTSTFTSVADMARRLWVPPFLVRDPFDNLAVVRAYDGPLLIMHGTRDEVIPYHHGQALKAAAPSARFVPLSCGHNDCLMGPRFWGEIWRFLEQRSLLEPAAPTPASHRAAASAPAAPTPASHRAAASAPAAPTPSGAERRPPRRQPASPSL